MGNLSTLQFLCVSVRMFDRFRRFFLPREAFGEVFERYPGVELGMKRHEGGLMYSCTDTVPGAVEGI